MACARELDRCIFCGGDEMTEEHIVADWVMRAFARSRKPPRHFSGTFVGRNQMRMRAEESFDTAKVVCRSCNNGWMSQIDTAAAEVLKPLVRGKGSVVTLEPEGQAAVAAWLFKSALIFDAAHNGTDGPLAGLRADFAARHAAPPGCFICAGPAPRTPFTVEGIPEIAGLTLFGVRTFPGRLNLTLNVKNPDGTVTPGKPRAIPTPGYLVMLGSLQAIISGRRAPVVPPSEQAFVRIWPTADGPVTVRSTRPGPDFS